jgi:hypothetical protein
VESGDGLSRGALSHPLAEQPVSGREDDGHRAGVRGDAIEDRREF